MIKITFGLSFILKIIPIGIIILSTYAIFMWMFLFLWVRWLLVYNQLLFGFGVTIMSRGYYYCLGAWKLVTLWGA